MTPPRVPDGLHVEPRRCPYCGDAIGSSWLTCPRHVKHIGVLPLQSPDRWDELPWSGSRNRMRSRRRRLVTPPKGET